MSGVTFDLTAARAARSEAKTEKRELKLDGDIYILPPALPIVTVDFMSKGEFVEGIKSLFGDAEGAQVLAKHNPDMNDFEELLEALYGFDAGK